MKRIVLSTTILIIILGVSAGIVYNNNSRISGDPVVLNNETPDRLSISFRTPRLEWENQQTGFMNNAKGEEFVQINAGEFAYTHEIGKPKLPMITSVIDAPHDAEFELIITNADFIEKDLIELGIDKRIMPALESSEKISGKVQDFVIDNQVYSTNAYYPENNADIIDNTDKAGYARGHRLVTVAFYPVQYNPVSGKVRIYTNADIDVRFKNGNTAKTEAAIRENYSKDWEDFISSMTINDMNAYKGVPSLPVYFDIFYNSAYQEAADSLAFWKSKKGYKVRMWDATG